MFRMVRITMGLLAGVLAIAVSWAGAAELAPEVVVLRYRTADQLLPMIQPLVPKPGTASGVGNELVIRTTRANFAEVKRVIDVLDRAPKRLLVTVRQDADAAQGGDAQIHATRAVDADQSVQQVQVLEGNEASIRIGQSVPVTLRSTNRRLAGGRVVDDSVDVVEFRDILSGFTVRPRIAGDTVVLDLSPQRDTPAGQGRGSTNVQRVVTTLSGRLGEWIEVGAVQPGQPVRSDAVVYGTRSAGSQARRILVKVESVD